MYEAGWGGVWRRGERWMGGGKDMADDIVARGDRLTDSLAASI